MSPTIFLLQSYGVCVSLLAVFPCKSMCSTLVSCVLLCTVAERREGASDDWGVDQQLISKLAEQYKQERSKGKKAMQSRKQLILQFFKFLKRV